MRKNSELRYVIRICCAGSGGEATLREICARVRSGLETLALRAHNLPYVLAALFETHPLAALDEFLLPERSSTHRRLFDHHLASESPVEALDADTLLQWAAVEPDRRFPILGQTIGMFERHRGEEGNAVSPLFTTILEQAPDKRAFLGDVWSRLHPNGWVGSLADILAHRRAAVCKMGDALGGEVQAWVVEALPEIDRWIEYEAACDSYGDRERSFE